MKRRWFVALALVVLLAGVAAWRAGRASGHFDAFFAAADRYDVLLRAAHAAGGPPPRATDPEVARLLRAMTDRSMLSLEAIQANDGTDLMNLTGRALRITAAYSDWGLPRGPENMQRFTMQNRNLVLYQDEIVPIFAFLVDMVGLEAEGQNRQAEALRRAGLSERQRRGVARMRRGLMLTLDGLLTTLAQPGMTPERKRELLEALARNAGQLAAILTVPERRRALTLIRRIGEVPLDPPGRAALARAGRAFSATACTGFCILEL